MLVTHDLPLLERGWESGHGLCPPEKWKSVVMATPTPSPRREGGSHGLCLYDIEEMEESSHDHPHTSSGRVGVEWVGWLVGGW